jgi:hypothetical protein
MFDRQRYWTMASTTQHRKVPIDREKIFSKMLVDKSSCWYIYEGDERGEVSLKNNFHTRS